MCSFKNFWRLCWALERKGNNFNATQLQNSKSGAHVWRQYVKKPLKFPIKFVYKMETTRGTSNISAFLNINSTVEDHCSALLHTQRSRQKQRVLLAWSVSLFYTSTNCLRAEVYKNIPIWQKTQQQTKIPCWSTDSEILVGTAHAFHVWLLSACTAVTLDESRDRPTLAARPGSAASHACFMAFISSCLSVSFLTSISSYKKMIKVWTTLYKLR